MYIWKDVVKTKCYKMKELKKELILFKVKYSSKVVKKYAIKTYLNPDINSPKKC